MRVGFGVGLLAGIVGSVGMAGTLAGQTPSADGVVVVLPAAQEAEDWRDGALGFVADSGLVIAAVVGGPTEYVVVAVPDTADVRYEAVLLAHDVGSGLGLLSVPRLAFEGYRFALVGAREGQEVVSVAWEPGDSAVPRGGSGWSPVWSRMWTRRPGEGAGWSATRLRGQARATWVGPCSTLAERLWPWGSDPPVRTHWPSAPWPCPRPGSRPALRWTGCPS